MAHATPEVDFRWSGLNVCRLGKRSRGLLGPVRVVKSEPEVVEYFVGPRLKLINATKQGGGEGIVLVLG